MHSAVQFSNSALFTSAHAADFLNHCKEFFKWNKFENILEVGCADGRVTKDVLYPFVENHLGHLQAVDVSEEAIDAAKRNNSIKNLTYSVLDITKEENGWKFENQYDHIFSFYCLHLLEPNAWIENFYKMTRKGGQIFATIYISPNIYSKTLNAVLENNDAPWAKYFDGNESILKYYGSNSPETVKDILEKSGFLVDNVDILKFRVIFPSFEPIKGMFHSADTFTKSLPYELHEEFWNDLYCKAKSNTEEHENGSHAYYMAALVFVATKL